MNQVCHREGKSLLNEQRVCRGVCSLARGAQPRPGGHGDVLGEMEWELEGPGM